MRNPVHSANRIIVRSTRQCATTYFAFYGDDAVVHFVLLLGHGENYFHPTYRCCSEYVPLVHRLQLDYDYVKSRKTCISRCATACIVHHTILFHFCLREEIPSVYREREVPLGFTTCDRERKPITLVTSANATTAIGHCGHGSRSRSLRGSSGSYPWCFIDVTFDAHAR